VGRGLSGTRAKWDGGKWDGGKWDGSVEVQVRVEARSHQADLAAHARAAPAGPASHMQSPPARAKRIRMVPFHRTRSASEACGPRPAARSLHGPIHRMLRCARAPFGLASRTQNSVRHARDMHATCMACDLPVSRTPAGGPRASPGAAGRRPARDRVRRAVLVGMRRLLPLRVPPARACPCALGGPRADCVGCTTFAFTPARRALTDAVPRRCGAVYGFPADFRL
jgi:hypothetical protein